jgi:hypothetical protein
MKGPIVAIPMLRFMDSGRGISSFRPEREALIDRALAEIPYCTGGSFVPSQRLINCTKSESGGLALLSLSSFTG